MDIHLDAADRARLSEICRQMMAALMAGLADKHTVALALASAERQMLSRYYYTGRHWLKFPEK